MNELPVLLFDNSGSDFKQYATVAEAQADAEALAADQFQIFTLYSSGQRPVHVNWTVATDHATNVRENKKVAVKTRSGAWTDLEEETLIKNFKAGMSKSELSKSLGRKYNSVYTKLTTLGLI